MSEHYVGNNRLEEIIRTYSDMIYRIAVVRCGSRADADDVFQEVCIKLVHYAWKLQSEEHIKAWLIKVTVNQCNTLLASRRSEAEFDDQLLHELTAETHELSELEYILVELLAKLVPPEYRMAIYLFYYGGYSNKEIGMIMNKSEGNIKTILSRARDKLGEQLKEKGITKYGQF